MDDPLSEAIEDFVETLAPEFEAAEPTDGSDHSLMHMDMYKKYTSLVESNLVDFAASLNLRPAELLSFLSDAISDRSDISSGANMATAIVALTSFDEFARMMRAFVREGQSPCVCPPLLNDEGELEFT